jgi:hypothetical protein
VNNNNLILHLKIFDILGKIIRDENFNDIQPGTFNYSFDGSNFSSGVYFYKINISSNGKVLFSDNKKMLLIK